MRRTTRLLASVRPEKYLEPGAPTGLTGLLTHSTPRATLIYLYASTLEKLKAIPTSSVYRQSVEGLTNHRLKIVQSVVPEGYEEYRKKMQGVMKRNPEAFDESNSGYDPGRYLTEKVNGITFAGTEVEDNEERSWDGDVSGPAKEAQADVELERLKKTGPENVNRRPGGPFKMRSDYIKVMLDPEPQFTAEQVAEVENQIGAGLIEEVIEVAEGEMELVDQMIKSKVWEELEEKPVEGQWTYFSRDTGTGTTQTPPQK